MPCLLRESENEKFSRTFRELKANFQCLNCIFFTGVLSQVNFYTGANNKELIEASGIGRSSRDPCTRVLY